MAYKNHSHPRKPLALQILTHLQPRMNLSTSERTKLENLNKGYEGEWKFYKLLEKELTAECVPLYSLQFEMNQTEFQIDSLLIFQNTI